jgi:hypothetical protein
MNVKNMRYSPATPARPHSKRILWHRPQTGRCEHGLVVRAEQTAMRDGD